MIESFPMQVDIIRPTTHNLRLVASEMQGNKWRELGHNYSTSYIRKFTENSDNYFLLAFIDGQVAGMLLAYIQQKMDPKRKKELYIDELEVKPRYQRMGVATALMDKSFQIAKQRGASSVWVLSLSDNLPANRLYRNFKLKDHKAKVQMYAYSVKNR